MKELKIVITKRDDPWLDNGILELAEMFRNIKIYDDKCIDFEVLSDRLCIKVYDKEKLIEYFTREIQNQLTNYIFIKVDDKNGGEKNVIKDHILLQYGSNLDGKNTISERLFSPKESKGIVSAFVNQELSDKKAQICVLCGEKYNASTASKLKINTLKQAVHPLTTKNSAVSHIRTEITKDSLEKGTDSEYYKNICINCYLLGVMQYANTGTIFYSDMSLKRSYMFMPYINNLKDAWEFRNRYINRVLTSTKRYSNLKFSGGKELDYKGKNSLFLLFLEKLAGIEDTKDNISQDLDIFEILEVKEDIKKFKNWYQLEVNTGKLKNPAVNTVKVLDNVYNVIFTEEVQPYIDVIKNTWFKGDYDTSYERKEMMAQAFVNDDFNKFVLAFKPSKGEAIRLKAEAYQKLDKLIYHWRWKQVGLNQETQKTIKAVARIIAATSEYRKSLIYRLEKVRTKSDLLSVLSEVIKGYYSINDKIAKEEKQYLNPLAVNDLATLLNDESIDKKQFEVIKDTLTINSFVSLSKNTKNEKGDK